MSLLTKDLISSWSALSDEALVKVLSTINQEFSKRFHFSDVDGLTRQELCEFISDRSETSSDVVNAALLEMIRLLARDRNGIDKILNEKVSKFVVESSGLVKDKSVSNFTLIEQAEKCLINALFNSAKTREVFEKYALPQLVNRLRSFLTGDFSSENCSFLNSISATDRVDLWFYDLRIAFIATAHSRQLQTSWREDADCFKVFLSTVEQALNEKRCEGPPEMAPPTPHLNRAGEALKTMFNILCHANGKYPEGTVVPVSVQCCAIVRRSEELGPDMVQHAVNLLATMPVQVDIICPKVDNTFDGPKYEDCDMTLPHVLLNAVSDKLDEKADASERELLGTFFTFLLVLCCESKKARRYCRLIALPPLKKSDVEKRPDEGDSLRNRLVRAMQQSLCRELAAEFLFVLCKRSVPRLIKYTGFGHSAGLLANRGLLGSINQRRESDSEDSETDEYKDIQREVNPVTGYLDQNQGPSPLDGMTDEQKEHEAMKLVNAIDQMMRSGAIKPATIGPDGRPREVEHVLEMVKDVPDQKGEESSDED